MILTCLTENKEFGANLNSQDVIEIELDDHSVISVYRPTKDICGSHYMGILARQLKTYFLNYHYNHPPHQIRIKIYLNMHDSIVYQLISIV